MIFRNRWPGIEESICIIVAKFGIIAAHIASVAMVLQILMIQYRRVVGGGIIAADIASIAMVLTILMIWYRQVVSGGIIAANIGSLAMVLKILFFFLQWSNCPGGYHCGQSW
jgi:hypothetical protein